MATAVATDELVQREQPQEALHSPFGRAVQHLEDAIANILHTFEEALDGDRTMGRGSRKLEELSREDIEAVHRAGDGRLLEEVALELLSESLITSIAPRLWQSIPVAAGTKPGERERPPSVGDAWHAKLDAGFSALCSLHSAHVALLGTLAMDSRLLIEQYNVHFGAALQESLGRGLAEKLESCMRQGWRSTLRVLPARSSKPDTEEWWWADPHGQQTAPGEADRVLRLLQASRRPHVPGRSSGSKAPGAGVVDAHEELLIEEFGSEAEVEEDEEDESMMEDDSNDVRDHEAFAKRFEAISKALLGLGPAGLVDVWRDIAMRFLMKELEVVVQARCRSEFDASGLLQKLTRWMYSHVLRWLRVVHGLPSQAPRTVPSGDLDQLRAEEAWWVAARQVVIRFFEVFVEVRLAEAFEMVRDFPDSKPALVDLRRCLAQTGNTGLLVQALRKQLSRRLLIAGAHTRDVIKVYIKTIKAMRLIDPRGLLLEAVSPPTRDYLRKRKDTVRCIITALTEDSDLQQELQSGAEVQRIGATGGNARPAPGASPQDAADGAATAGRRPVPDGAVQGDADWAFSAGGADFDISDDEDPDCWMPDPLDADPLLPSRVRRSQDVISLLVGIYGSKEMFIKEYKEMLADRLLGTASYATEKEAQNLELLKTRFGEAALTHCEVMLQDIKDSRRINMNVHKQQVDVTSQVSGRCPPRAPVAVHPQGQGSSQLELGQSAQGASRPFMAPFSLSGIFGLCMSPGSGGVPSLADGTAGVAGAAGMSSAALEAGSKVGLEHMQALILSKHYWPSTLAKEEHPNFQLPQVLEDSLAEYSSAYSKIRAKRSLSWKKTHGLVEVTVDLKDRSLSVVVTPVHLAVLSCFTDSPSDGPDDSLPPASGSSRSARRHSGSRMKTLQEVAASLELPEELVRKRIGFWVSKEVLREVGIGVFEVQEESGSGAVDADGGGGAVHMDDDAEQTGPSSNAAHANLACAVELEACEALLQGILTNHASLPLSRVHNFLQMFMMDPPYTQTEEQLSNFLTKLCHEGRLEYNGSAYSLAKKL